jgi:L-ornithine N5-monooxygenase
MTHTEMELLAIGGGPANLALAVAIEELAPRELAKNSLVIERDTTIAWQRGMLLPEAQSQVSFLKDLVTHRNPGSRFTFLSYLHSVGRLDDFINLGTFWPYRAEMSDYLRWVAGELAHVKVECGRACVAVEPSRSSNGVLTGWVARLADGSTIGSRYLVVGAGRDANMPAIFGGLPAARVIHSTEYLTRLGSLPKEAPHRIAVIGGAQSAAEMLCSVMTDMPNCRATMVMRSAGLNHYQTSPFTNQLYYPSFVDDFFAARPETRAQILREMHQTNYGGLTPTVAQSLYQRMYRERFNGTQRLRISTLTDVTAAREEGDEVVLELTDRRTGAVEDLRCDLVLLGTGFSERMPALIRMLSGSLGLDQVTVNRAYRLQVPGPTQAACYLQGVNESTHGIADSLLSVLAARAAEITQDVMAHRAESAPTAAPSSPPSVPVAVPL